MAHSIDQVLEQLSLELRKRARFWREQQKRAPLPADASDARARAESFTSAAAVIDHFAIHRKG